jgi:hypothetical protein
MKKPRPDITFQISDRGVERVVVFADNAQETHEAFSLLARVAPEFQNLDTALKGQTKSGPAARKESTNGKSA